MKKILFLFENFKVGGSEIALIKIANNLLPKYDITFLVLQDIGNAKTFLDPKIKIINVNNGNKGIKFGFLKVIKNIYYSNPKFIISSKPHLSVIYIFLFLKFKLIYREPSNPNRVIVSNINSKFQLYFFNFFDFINKFICYKYIYLSDLIYHNSNQKNFKSICVIPNIIHEPECLKIQSKCINVDYLKIVSIGRISDEKNYFTVLKSLKKLKKNNFKFHYSICYGSISDTKLFNKLKAFIIKNNLSNEIEFVSFLKDPFKLLLDSNVFLSPSKVEGMSSTLYTSFLFNKINIASDYFREELTDYDVVFFKTNSVSDLFHKLMLVSKDLTSLTSKSLKNSKLVKERYSKTNIISKWEKILQ